MDIPIYPIFQYKLTYEPGNTMEYVKQHNLVDTWCCVHKERNNQDDNETYMIYKRISAHGHYKQYLVLPYTKKSWINS